MAELGSGPQTVHELCELMSTTQQNVSKHLGLLHHAGLASRQPVGAQVVYALADPSGVGILEQAAEAVARQASGDLGLPRVAEALLVLASLVAPLRVPGLPPLAFVEEDVA
jgi:hypothetical protein